MKRLFIKKPQALIGAVATLLTVVFVGLAIGPVFLSAAPYNPVTPLVDEESELYKIYDEEAALYDPDTYTATPKDNPTPSEAAKSAAKLAVDKAQQEDLAKKFTCLSWGGMNLNACMASLMDKVMWLSARTLWISGVLFNITVSTTLNFNDLLTRLPIVDIGWKVLRDLANIVFIFIALWAGISITLGIGDDGKKAWGLLAQMVLVALFINFSLFITKAVVDASNVASLHFYSLIVEPGHEKDYDKGLSEAFLYGLNLSTLYDSKKLGAGGEINADKNLIAGATQGSGKELSFTNIILIGFFGSLFIIVTAWVFFAAAIMFIYRAVTLMMLMMLSPLAFVGFILPGASGMAHAWWSKLWSQAFFAPLYLALAYVVVRTINADGFREGLGGNSSFAAALTGTGSPTVAVIFNFILLIGLMVGCLVVAQSLGAKGSEMAMSGWEKIKHVAVGETSGLIGRTAVRGIHFSEDSKFLDNRLTRRMGIADSLKRNFGGKEFLSVRKWNERLEKSRFGQGDVGKFFREQTTGKLTHATFGGSKSADESYEEGEHMASRRRDIEWGRQARTNAQGLRPLREEERTRQEAKLHAEEAVNEAEKKLDTAKQQGKTGVDLKPFQDAVVTARGHLVAADKDLNIWSEKNSAEIKKFTSAIAKALAQMSTEGFLNQQKSFFTQPEVMDITVLGADKYNALMKSEHFTEPEKHEYTEARVKRMHDVAHRGEERTRWYNEAWPRYQRSLEDFEKIVKEKIDPKSTSTHGNGNALPTIQKDIAALQKELAVETSKKKEEQDPERIKSLNDQLTTAYGEEAEAQEVKATLIREGVQRGELEEPEMPKQPGWKDADDIRKAMRNMRGTEEVVNWYHHARPVLDFELVEQTLMQGLLDKVRESPEVDSEFKEQWRVDKRGYIRDSGWAVAGMDAVKMQKMHEVIGPSIDRFLSAINKQMQEVGDKQYFSEFNKKTIEQNGEMFSAQELLDKVTAEYNGKVAPENKITDDVPVSERELRSRAGYTQYSQVAPNLANNEFSKMPGILRNLYVVLKKLDEATLAPYSDRDLDQKLPMLEFFLKEFLRDVQGKGEMSKENAQIWTYFVNKGGTQFVPFGTLTGENAKLMHLIASMTGRDDPRSLSAGSLGRMSNTSERAKGMAAYNQYRAAAGLSPLNVEDETNLEKLGIKNRRSS